MDQNEEYHDPDYPGTSVCVKEEPPSISDDEKSEKIKKIIHREFSNELEIRENEIMLIDQRMTNARRLLHRLRYSLVNSYYQEQKLQLGNSQIQDNIAVQHEPRARAEVSSLLREGQRRLHPSLRKLLGKQTVDIEEIFRSRVPRNKTRKDYSAMLQKRNYTIGADTTKSLRPDKKEEIEDKQQACTSKPKKVPRHLEPKVTANVVTVDEATRNKMKHRYRIVIGNTSKYAPPASLADRSTHKWLLYVRGPPLAPDLRPLLTAVTVRLHHSYAPHHTVHIDKPPYHISRRGWGEFPAKIELHFVLPDMNRPAMVEHTIKLDRNYTGMQMLGAETLVDVWLYSTQEMVKYEFKEDEQETQTAIEPDVQTNIPTDIQLKEEPQELDNNTSKVQNCENQTENWLDFFSKPTELDVDQMIIKPEKKVDEKNDLEAVIDKNITEKVAEIKTEEVVIKTEPEWNESKTVEPMDIPNEILNQPTSIKKRIVKYIDPTTGKIYYIEMDRTLDLTKVQEIVINNTKTAKISPIKSNGLKNVRKKKGVSLLKPELKSLLKTENSAVKNDRTKANLAHIENDHCYLATPLSKMQCSDSVLPDSGSEVVKIERNLYDCLCSVVGRFTCLRAAVNHMVMKIPIVTDHARDPDFVKHFPFVVENEEKYWKLDFAKRRNIEWSRAKLINKILTEHFLHSEPIWRTKQILLYSRLHGHYPVRPETTPIHTKNNEWSSWNDLESTRKLESNIKEIYPNASDISTLTTFSMNTENLSDTIDLSDDEEVDIIGDKQVVVKREVVKESVGLKVLPVECEQERMMFLYIERKCSDIGIELRNEDVGNGYSYSAVHAVLLSAMKSFAEEMIRSALAAKLTMERNKDPLPTVWTGWSTPRAPVCLEHVLLAVTNPRLQLIANRARGVPKKKTYAI